MVNHLLLGKKYQLQIRERCQCLVLSDDQLRQMMVALEKSMDEGLAKETASTAAVKMLPSYVRAVPNGTERGQFLSLDLGGTNFRVLLIRLSGKEAEMTGKIFRIPESVMCGTGEALFDHIADCMAKFMTEEGVNDVAKLPLGFTFSFPCEQNGLTSAKLINWTKGFTASNVEGADVVRLLREACQRRKDIDIDVVAVLNDTVGTLMACAFKENNCRIGVIVGTGTNACYMEKLDLLEKIGDEIKGENVSDEVKHLKNLVDMIINTEWGAFGDDGVIDWIITPFDRQVDALSINPGKQLFEKMISGMYMGELVRVVLEALAQDGLLFNSKFEAISRHGCFPTKFVSEIETDLLEDDLTFQKTFQILEDIGVESVSSADCENVAYVCRVVSTRAAQLTAAGIATLLKRTGRREVTVGLDGSVYRFHPSFRHLLEEKIGHLITNDIKYQLMLSEDGSGRGAAVVAAVASRMKQQQQRQLQQQ
ncbi:unnamed protein product [Angiostrongylus costaricensis]|uniref:Phosphotransferase n=1 Tax=Angiostrongylus costaricensis TaxID=334426 RepID=A0A0R3PPJ2_ANGCS|nr:unnamed protein product [Angiostrongylus costaricensis]